MTKVVLTNPATFVSDATAVAQVAANNAALVVAIENTVSRDGTAPNGMNGDFDMNSHRILNLPAPASDNEPARRVDIGNAPASAAAAAASAVLADADVVLTHADVVLTHADVVLTHADVVATAANVQALSATSTTSLLIATGAKVFTTQSGKLFIPGQFLQIASTANSANFMHGQVTTYSGTTLTMNVTDIGGSGTLADWKISISGTQGSQGIQGNTGATGATGISGTPTVNQFATWLNATTVQGVSITGLVKGNGALAPSAATANTDFLPVNNSALTGSTTFSGTIVNASALNQYGVSIAARLAGSSFEFGHVTTGYGSTLGAENSSGTPYLAFSAGKGTSTNTYKTLGLLGSLFRSDLAGGFVWGTLSATNADNQTPTVTMTLNAAGTLAATSLADANGAVFSNIPQNSQSAAYTLVLVDGGKHIFHPSVDTTARTWTIPANASVAYPIGTTLTFINQHNAGVVTLAIATDTMRMAGSGTTGSRTLTADGIATAIKVTSTEWIISGTGLS